MSAVPPFPSGVTRRSFLTGVGLSGAGLLLAACGGPGSTASPTSAAAAASGSGTANVTGTVNFYHWRSEDKAVLDTLAASFAEKYPGVSVTQTIDPSEQYQSTAAQKARDGSIGDALTALRGTQFSQFSEQNIFTDLSSSGIADNYVENLITPGRTRRQAAGVPVSADLQHAAAEHPDRRQGRHFRGSRRLGCYIAALEKFKSAGVDPIVWPGNDPANAFQIINTLAMNNGPTPDMFTGIEDGRYKATDDWWLKSLTQFQQLSGTSSRTSPVPAMTACWPCSPRARRRSCPPAPIRSPKCGGRWRVPDRARAADHHPGR